MAIDKDLIKRVRALDQYDLRRLVIFARGLLIGAGDTPYERPTPRTEPKVTYRQQSVKCGKTGCTRCPHGPYWYAYWREDGRLRSRYIGRTLPEPVAD